MTKKESKKEVFRRIIKIILEQKQNKDEKKKSYPRIQMFSQWRDARHSGWSFNSQSSKEI